MFIIYSFNHPKGPDIHYVSGVFRHRADAEKYLQSIPSSLKNATHRLEEIPETEYPIYFIEEDFRVGPAHPIDRLELARKIAMMPKIEDENHEYFTFYRFMGDYQGRRSGEDYLGTTDHTHVDNDLIIWSLDASIQKGEVRQSPCYYYCQMCGQPAAGIFEENHWSWNPPKEWIKERNPESPTHPGLFCGQKCRDDFKS